MKEFLVQDPHYRLYNMHVYHGDFQEKKPVGWWQVGPKV